MQLKSTPGIPRETAGFIYVHSMGTELRSEPETRKAASSTLFRRPLRLFWETVLPGNEPRWLSRQCSDICTTENLGVTKLLSPPFSDISESKSGKDPGYIKGYPEGMRENGGQYTHAAVWAAWALYDTGSPDAAFKLLREIDPSSHPAEIYKAEPYALAGDVSVNEHHYGEAGWSLYTGAAAWYYRLILEKFIGFDERGGLFQYLSGNNQAYRRI